jgi:Ca-activated chloride channel family protein
VAVSDDVRVNPSEVSVSVQVPVEMPEAVNYRGIFGSASMAASSQVTHSVSIPSKEEISFYPFSMEEQKRDFKKELKEIKERLISFKKLNITFSESCLKVMIATGLDEEAIALLTQHLQSIEIPTEIKGDLVLELKINKGRVKQVILDEEASTIQEAIGLRITVRTFLNLETLSPLTVPCSLFPVPFRVAL